MSSHALKQVNKIKGVKPNARAVLITISTWHRSGGSVIATYQQISRHTGISKRSISRHLFHLEERELLRRRACRIPAKRHLTEIELLFLEFAKPQEQSNPSQNREPKRPGNEGQMGFPRTRDSNAPYIPQTLPLLDGGVEVDFRLEPEVFRFCCNILSWDINQVSLRAPIRVFRVEMVQKARLKVA